MTPPNASETPGSSHVKAPRSAVLSCSDVKISTLAKRPDFLRAARARRQGTASFLLQARKRADDENAVGIRIGYTCSKKVGNAIKRNHAKRRLREIARALIPTMGHDGWDYVLIGKKIDTSARPFELLTKDLEKALIKIHSDRNGGPK